LVDKLTFFKHEKNKIKIAFKIKNIKLTNLVGLCFSIIDNKDFIIEEIENFSIIQPNWVQNRHFKKKILKNKKFCSISSSFKKIDLIGWVGLQQFHNVNLLLSFDIFQNKQFDFFFEKLLLSGSKSDNNMTIVNNF